MGSIVSIPQSRAVSDLTWKLLRIISVFAWYEQVTEAGPASGGRDRDTKTVVSKALQAWFKTSSL